MINKVLDLVFPKRCVQCKKEGSYICENCFAFLSFDTKSICLVCQRPVPDNLTHKLCLGKYTIDGCFSAIPYNKTAKKLLYSFKYKPYVTDLRKISSNLLYEFLIQNENFNKVLRSSKNWIFVPIPLFPTKLRSRGYNQSEILTNELGKKLDIKTLNILKRVKKTKTQVGLKLEERKKNIKGAFALSFPLKNQQIFLVDDVVTTGSTLLEATNILKRGGASRVYAVTLARD